jgi:hypothetical protein
VPTRHELRRLHGASARVLHAPWAC